MCICRQMAQAGFAVLRFDLSGTGDSDGRLADLGWPHWLADSQAALQALRDASSDQDPDVPLWLWGVRGGAMLSAALAAERPALYEQLRRCYRLDPASW